jgi:hypothetical protein
VSEHHQHQHVVEAVGSGASLDQAIFNAVAGLTDPEGHHAGFAFEAFEVQNIKGTIVHKPGDHGTPDRIRVTIRALGTHVK